MECLLLLWDELDELLGYGRHLAVGMTHSLTGRRPQQTVPVLAIHRPATAETGHHRVLKP